jgi:hypothetical protein
MKKMVLLVASLFMLSCVVASFDAQADMRSETKKEQDAARAAGKKRAEDMREGKKGSPKDDGYRDMDPDQKEAYKKGYREGQ